jgi:hypothetical protein
MQWKDAEKEWENFLITIHMKSYVWLFVCIFIYIVYITYVYLLYEVIKKPQKFLVITTKPKLKN